MKRKIMYLLCAFALMAAVMCGCGNNAEEKPVNGSQPAEDSKKPEETRAEETQSEESRPEEGTDADAGAEELEYVELNWYVTSNARDVDLIQTALDEYFLERLNCKVNLHCVEGGWDTYADTVSPKLMAGDDDIDICTLLQSVPYLSYASMGALYPVDTLWDEYGANVKGLFSEGVWDSLKVDGHIYAVPILKDNAYIIGYIYNDTLASELGLDLENTGWTSFMDMEDVLMNAITLRDEKFPEYKGMPLISTNCAYFPFYFAYESFINGSSLAVCNLPGKEAVPGIGADTVYNFFETDEFRELCLLEQRLTQAGVLAYDYSTYETNLRAEPSTLISGAWGYTWIDEHLFGDAYSAKLVVFDGTWVDASNYTSAAMAIGANCKDPERAMMVMELLNSDPYIATLLRFGVEGEHWEYDADGRMQLANRNADAANAGWLEWYGFCYGNLTIVDGPESYVGPDGIMLERMAEYNDEAILASHMGFVLDTSEIENEISACNNVIAEYGYLTLGRAESQEAVNQAVDELVAKLKENGSEKIVAEVQRQIDEWAASK